MIYLGGRLRASDSRKREFLTMSDSNGGGEGGGRGRELGLASHLSAICVKRFLPVSVEAIAI